MDDKLIGYAVFGGVMTCYLSNKMNDSLRKELLAMVKEDQDVLRELQNSGELGTIEYHPRIKAIHERNNKRIKEIISEHGWPGIDIVGKDGAEAAWLITQHADQRQLFFPCNDN